MTRKFSKHRGTILIKGFITLPLKGIIDFDEKLELGKLPEVLEEYTDQYSHLVSDTIKKSAKNTFVLSDKTDRNYLD